MVVFERQTETGSIVVTPFPGAIETKPGSATVPFFGHQSVILDAVSGKVFLGRNWQSGWELMNLISGIGRQQC